MQSRMGPMQFSLPMVFLNNQEFPIFFPIARALDLSHCALPVIALCLAHAASMHGSCHRRIATIPYCRVAPMHVKMTCSDL